jgi:hypothetical protein
MVCMSDHAPYMLLPIPTALALTRAHLQHQRGELSDAQLQIALQLELAGHEDLKSVIEAQAFLSAVTLEALMAYTPEGVTAEGFLASLEGTLPDRP